MKMKKKESKKEKMEYVKEVKEYVMKKIKWHKETAEEVLTELHYPQEKIKMVIGCVYNHRSSKNATNIEELCVADADILAHFDNIPMVFDIMFNVRGMQLAEGREELEKYIEKDYNDLSDKTKKVFKDRYEIIKDVLIVK